MNLQLIGMTFEMPVDHLDQRTRLRWHALIAAYCQRLHCARAGGEWSVRAQHKAQQIARRVGLVQCAFRQRDGERPLRAQQQFRPPQTVDTQIAFQRAVECHSQHASGPRFAHEGLRQRKHARSGFFSLRQRRLWVDVHLR